MTYLLWELNDYLIKPFDNNEPLARVKIQLKHRQVAFSSALAALITYKDIILDENSYKVTCNEIRINLSKIEFKLLKILLESPTRVLQKIFYLKWFGTTKIQVMIIR